MESKNILTNGNILMDFLKNSIPRRINTDMNTDINIGYIKSVLFNIPKANPVLDTSQLLVLTKKTKCITKRTMVREIYIYLYRLLLLFTIYGQAYWLINFG